MKEQLKIWTQSNPHPFSDTEALKGFTTFIAGAIQTDFFTTQWHATSLDHSEGHKFFIRALQKAYESDRETVDGRWPLFREA